jgi:FixJ family two-component response regulator
VKTATILVVDDDRALRQTADALRAAGYEVLGPAPAPRLLLLEDHRQARPALTDVGWREWTAAAAEAVQSGAGVKCCSSGYTGGAALHDTVREDGVDFIAKPFVTETLLKKVRSILKGA